MHAFDVRRLPAPEAPPAEPEGTRLATVEQLRERIRKLQAAPRRYLASLRTGVAPFDALFPAGGLPLGHAVELCGEAASGRTTLALRAVAAAHRERRLCAWVDAARELYPPAARALGADLERLLLVRPHKADQGSWAALQLARSGAFTCVVLDLTRTGVRLSLAEGKKLADAATKSGSLLVLLTAPDAPGEGMTRVSCVAEGVQGVRVEVMRSRQGAAGRSVHISWDTLCPGAPPSWSNPRGALLASALPQVAPPEIPDFVRVRASAIRNGEHPPHVHGGDRAPHLHGSTHAPHVHGGDYAPQPGMTGAPRPGRDGPLPKLEPLLGTSGSRCCGGGGIVGQRPGRDRALPRLEALLSVGEG